MTVRYYCIQLFDDNKVITIRADEMCRVRQGEYKFKIGDQVVAQVMDEIRAWWIEERKDEA